MKKKQDKPKNTDDLRNNAEKTLEPVAAPLEKLTDTEVRKLAHELQVYQIKLEMQNEELRKAQLEVEESRQKYLDLYDFAPVGYLTFDVKGIILEANLTITEMLGTERSLLVDILFHRSVIREDQDVFYLYLNEVFAGKEQKYTCEIRLRGKNNTTFYTRLDSTLALKPGGDHICRTSVTDITEQKKMEETLIQSEKLKSLGTITAGVAHEFNNLLAVIVGTAELLETDSKDELKLVKGLNTIIKASDDGAEIVRNMISYTQLEAKDPSDYISFDISKLLKEAIDFTTPRWKNMAQLEEIVYQIEMEGMREIPEIFCNTTELRGVFTNIINNALDAMPNGGSLSFSTWSNDDNVFVSISDTGKGMPEDVRKKIFDPFFTTRRPLGTGLGLSVSYGVIVRHGGKIEVESEEGKGTIFNVSIPIRKDTVRKIVPSEPDRRVTRRKLHILVVDDNEDVCEIMDNVLTRGGHAVKSVDNGVEAIELAGKEDFDLVLCDLLMPVIHGYDVIKAINKLGKPTKVGIITGWDEALKPIDNDVCKVDFILKKPFKHSELAKHINELFGADGK